MADQCCSTQLIDGNGEFNVDGLHNFVRTTKLAECGLSYAVAITGSQSSERWMHLGDGVKQLKAFGWPRVLASSPLQWTSIWREPMGGNRWEVSPQDMLITLVQCKSLWRQFKAEPEYSVTQAISAQEAHKKSNNWLPPPWAIVAMVVFGFNEFMILLKNPLYLMILFVGYLLSKAIWVQMDIAGEF